MAKILDVKVHGKSAGRIFSKQKGFYDKVSQRCPAHILVVVAKDSNDFQYIESKRNPKVN